MLKKHFYEAPESEQLFVKFEENFCTTGPTGGAGGTDPYAPGDGDDMN